MQAISRGVPRAACRQFRQRCGTRQTVRRYADDHGSSHARPTESTASFGTSFYVVVASIPAAVLLYQITRNNTDGSLNPITAAFEKYTNYRDTWHERNALHFRMVEQAAFDKNLFHNTATLNYRELEYPEVFNTGGNVNVRAGHKANLEAVIEHYKKRAFDEEEEKLRKMKAGEIPGQEQYKEIPPATPSRKK